MGDQTKTVLFFFTGGPQTHSGLTCIRVQKQTGTRFRCLIRDFVASGPEVSYVNHNAFVSESVICQSQFTMLYRSRDAFVSESRSASDLQETAGGR